MAEVGAGELSTITKSIRYSLSSDDFAYRTEKVRFPALVCTDDCRNVLFNAGFR